MPQRSARQTPEENLWRSEEMFRLLVESVREYAIFLLDPTGHIATWNQGAQRLKGYRADEIVGSHFSVFYPPEVPRPMIDAELDQAVAEGQFRDEGWRVRKDGSRFWADVTITPVRDTAGILRGFAKVTRDMTARRAADEERAELIREQAARAEAERANRMKDEFLATLSHELRTPLNAIVGWAHILATERVDGAAFRKAVEVIRRNAIAQTQLISDIFDISRIQSGNVHLNMRSMNLASVVDAAVDALAPAAAAKAIVVTRVLDREVGAVAGDPDRLQQVAWNLLSNAVKFTPRGGQVEVRLQRQGDQAELLVRDDGPGIDPGFLPHAFEPFRQADSSASRSHGGLGLGLAIVRHLVELHGGRVRAESKGPGGGATFVVDLPLRPTSAVEVPPQGNDGDPAWETFPNLTGLTVLVVEDDDDARELIETTLERLGARVEAARSAAEARERLRANHPDVLVSDIEMPEESGYDLMRQVRDLPVEEGGLVPAIALTAYAHSADRLRALSAGFQMHLAKPVHPRELASSIATLTGRVRPV